MRRKLTHVYRPAMTLLELILSLALSALLLMSISMALHIHWKAFDVRRSRVEEAQLARAILRNVADDIRSTFKFEPPDLSGLSIASAVSGAIPAGDSGGEGSDNGDGGSGTGDGSGDAGGGAGGAPMTGGENPPTGPNQGTTDFGQNQPTGGDGASGTTGFGGQSGAPAGGTEATGGGTSATGTSGSGDSTGGTQSSTDAGSEATTESVASSVVGLYGTATELQFDISRLPRLDQYQGVIADDVSVTMPSDVKTIVYFLASEDSAAATGGALASAAIESSTSGRGSGLMRAETDRAVAAWGELNGAGQSSYGAARMLAEEVTSLEFRYFDGAEWLSEWNSDEAGGLPTAIEVLMTLSLSGAGASQSSGASFSSSPFAATAAQPDERVYRMVVQLPVGGLIPATAETTETEDMTGTTGTEATESGDPSGSGGSGESSGGTGAGGGGTGNPSPSPPTTPPTPSSDNDRRPGGPR